MNLGVTMSDKTLKNSVNLNLHAKYEAFKYQKRAFEFAKELEYSAIFHEQGLGKTKIAIDLMLFWLQEKDLDTVLIVTKKQLVENWKRELSNHTYLKPAVLSSDKKANFFVFNSPSRVILANFEAVSSELSRFKLFLNSRKVGIIIDESAKLKNPDSKLTKNYFEISGFFVRKCIMTGTPVANRPYDIWAQIFFLDKGKSLGENFSNFKKNTDLSNDLFSNEKKREDFEEGISLIFSKISKFSIRERKTKDIINLPDKKYINILSEFEPTQLIMYNKVREEMEILLNKGNTDFLDDSSENLKRLLRLVQITSNPMLIDDAYKHIPGKMQKLVEIVTKIIDRGEKCIVWSIFIENIDNFTKAFEEYNPVKIHGKMKMESRNISVKKFIEDENVKILFATPQAAKEGLTLTVANNVVFYDRSFSLDDYLQAQDRIHRVSQIKECRVYNIIMKNSIDEWIDTLLEAKTRAADLSQGDITLEEYLKHSDYSFGEIVKKILNKGDEFYE